MSGTYTERGRTGASFRMVPCTFSTPIALAHLILLDWGHQNTLSIAVTTPTPLLCPIIDYVRCTAAGRLFCCTCCYHGSNVSVSPTHLLFNRIEILFSGRLYVEVHVVTHRAFMKFQRCVTHAPKFLGISRRVRKQTLGNLDARIYTQRPM